MTRSEPLSPMEIELKIAQTMDRLDDAVNVLKALVEASAGKKYDWEMAKAKATMQARVLDFGDGGGKPSVAEKAAWVTVETAELELAYNIAAGQVTAQKAVVHALESDGELLRTLARSARDLVEGPGYGGGGRG